MKNNWRSVKLITAVKDEVLNAFDDCGWLVSHDADAPIIWEGDTCQAVYFVQSGGVEIYRTAVDGREHTLGIMLVGDVFNLVPALRQDGDNTANARCIQKTSLLVVGKKDIKRILNKFPDFAVTVLGEMAKRLTVMTRKAGALALHSVRQRLAAFLIAEADKAKMDKHIFWTRDDMARQIGTVRDVVGRNLGKFEAEGIIKRKRGNILLLKRAGLERIANGEDKT